MIRIQEIRKEDYRKARAFAITGMHFNWYMKSRVARMTASLRRSMNLGTALLTALEKDEPGKEVYLFTDNACTYQFYEHRGFERYDERDVRMKLKTGEESLKCFLYRKRIN